MTFSLLKMCKTKFLGNNVGGLQIHTSQMSFEQFDFSKKYGTEWFPTQTELKTMDFQDFSPGIRRKDGTSDCLFCEKTQNYLYSNHFWDDNNKPHYYHALDHTQPPTEEQQKVCEQKQKRNSAIRKIESAIAKCIETIEDYGQDIDVSDLPGKKYRNIFELCR